MALFTSSRERRLWKGTLAVLAAIYAAGIAAGSLVDTVGSEVLLGVAFTAGFVFVVAAVVGMALAPRAKAEFWVALGVAATYVMIPVRSGIATLERTHLFEYGLLAVLLYEAMAERRKNGGALRLPGLIAIVTAAILGWLDEAVQALLPGRVYDNRDVAVNILAAIVAVAAAATLRWARERAARVPAPPTASDQAEVDGASQ